jgi:hypothetical protein
MLWLCVRRAGQAERCEGVYSSWGTGWVKRRRLRNKYWIGKILHLRGEGHLLLGKRERNIKFERLKS